MENPRTRCPQEAALPARDPHPEIDDRVPLIIPVDFFLPAKKIFMFNNMYTSPEKYQSSKKRNSKEDIKNDKRHQPTDYRNKRHRQHIL